MPVSSLSSARTRIKTAVADRRVRPESIIGWVDVLRAVQTDEARRLAMAHYRARGFEPDDFEHRRQARAAMADALTRTEDWLELAGRDIESRRRERAAIRNVRRRLEWELWP